MRLFLKEHAPLIVLQIFQFIIIASIYWLDGYHEMRTAVYAIFLVLFFLGCYLLYNYYSRRKLYRRLSEPLEKLDDSYQDTDLSPVSKAFDVVLKQQYRLYVKEIKQLESEQEEHRKFMDQWVHQMKTPLSVIELSAQNLDEPESSNIREETDRMKTGLNTILYMARLRTIEQDFHIKQVPLARIVNEVNSENKRFYIRNQVYPKLEMKTEGITVETDEKWLFFMLSQLINNAVKYSAGKSKRMVISIYQRADEAVLEVTDFGAGIPDTDRRRIFDPFYTGENGRKYRESTGMGLYLLKEAADHLGHQIELESEVGNGTSMRIIFSETQNLTTL